LRYSSVKSHGKGFFGCSVSTQSEPPLSPKVMSKQELSEVLLWQNPYDKYHYGYDMILRRHGPSAPFISMTWATPGPRHMERNRHLTWGPAVLQGPTHTIQDMENNHTGDKNTGGVQPPPRQMKATSGVEERVGKHLPTGGWTDTKEGSVSWG
jgi:hypothetical protein